LAPHLAHVRDTATVDNPLGLGHGEGIDGTTTCDRCGRRYEVTLYAVLELRAVIVSQCSCGEANATAKRPAPTLGRGDDGHGDAARPKTGQAMISRSEGRARGRAAWAQAVCVVSAVSVIAALAACGTEEGVPEMANPSATSTAEPPVTQRPTSSAPAQDEPAQTAPPNQRPAKPKKTKPKRKPPAGRLARVVDIYDGDTLTVASGARVRLLQIDTPELREGECYASQATTALERLVPIGATVRLVADPALDRVDRYDRLLRYLVRRDGVNVNLALVRQGAAAPYFYDSHTGEIAGRLYGAGVAAKKAHRGLWGACPATRLRPSEAITTLATAPEAVDEGGSGGNCTPGYKPCLPVRDDWDCGELSQTYTVTGADPYRLDGDDDGYGCE
jgi:endonuclease YncB( thermonuclease family)